MQLLRWDRCSGAIAWGRGEMTKPHSLRKTRREGLSHVATREREQARRYRFEMRKIAYCMSGADGVLNRELIT
jgi:hypothetical protein